MDHTYIFAYNLFIIGYLTLPIARQIELFSRYNAVFYFFIAVVFASILIKIYAQKSLKVRPIVIVFI